MSRNNLKSKFAAIGFMSVALVLSSAGVGLALQPSAGNGGGGGGGGGGGNGGAGSYVGDNVTICHRTNAITNPYVEITIDPNAILNGNDRSSHGPQNTNHNRGTGVFDPTFDYPNNAKDWQDIIPPFDYTLDGTPGTFPGYNYSGRGLQIYNNGCNGNFDVPTTTADPSVPTTTAPLPRNGVRVTVYLDLNDNCQQDEGEPGVPDIAVEAAKNTKKYYVTTGADGSIVEGPLPAGDYEGEITADLTSLVVSCTNENSTTVPGNGIGDIKIGLKGDKEIEIVIDPPTNGPPPTEIEIHWCGQDEVCDNEDDLDFKVPLGPGGRASTRNIPNGKYYVVPIGSDGERFASSSITVDGSTTSFSITAVTLPPTGSNSSRNMTLAVMLLFVTGGVLLVSSRRRQSN